MYGRKPVYVASMLVFTILIIPCGLGDSLSEVIVVRFFGAIAGAAMIANSPGTIGDISTEEYRALFFSIWSIGPLNGPTFGELSSFLRLYSTGTTLSPFVNPFFPVSSWLKTHVLRPSSVRD